MNYPDDFNPAAFDAALMLIMFQSLFSWSDPAIRLIEFCTSSVASFVVHAPPGTLERRYVLARALKTLAPGAPCYHVPMRLRTRLNLVIAGLSAIFVFVLIAAEVQSTRTSIREEIEAANRVAAQLISRLASIYSNIGGPDTVLQFLQQLGRVRANEVYLLDADDDGHPHTVEAVRHEAARQPGQIVKTGGGPSEAEDGGRAQDDEQHDGRDLDGREPEFDRAEVVHGAGVEIQQDQAESQ